MCSGVKQKSFFFLNKSYLLGISKIFNYFFLSLFLVGGFELNCCYVLNISFSKRKTGLSQRFFQEGLRRTQEGAKPLLCAHNYNCTCFCFYLYFFCHHSYYFNNTNNNYKNNYYSFYSYYYLLLGPRPLEGRVVS